MAFVRTGRSVRVDPAGSLGDDRHEVDLLRGTIEGLIPPGGSDEAVPFILDALTVDTTAFRHPVRPLGELLQAAGLEQRGFSFGRIGDDWLTLGEQHALRTRRRLADTWGFNQCCQAAFDQAYGALERAQQGEGVDARAIATSLSHGVVVPPWPSTASISSGRPNWPSWRRSDQPARPGTLPAHGSWSPR